MGAGCVPPDAHRFSLNLQAYLPHSLRFSGSESWVPRICFLNKCPPWCVGLNKPGNCWAMWQTYHEPDPWCPGGIGTTMTNSRYIEWQGARRYSESFTHVNSFNPCSCRMRRCYLYYFCTDGEVASLRSHGWYWWAGIQSQAVRNIRSPCPKHSIALGRCLAYLPKSVGSAASGTWYAPSLASELQLYEDTGVSH